MPASLLFLAEIQLTRHPPSQGTRKELRNQDKQPIGKGVKKGLVGHRLQAARLPNHKLPILKPTPTTQNYCYRKNKQRRKRLLTMK